MQYKGVLTDNLAFFYHKRMLQDLFLNPMSHFRQRKSRMLLQTKILCRFTKPTLLAGAICLLMPLFSSCGEQRESAADQKVQQQSDSFTFFDLGANSRLSEKVRDNLSQRLGNAAVADRGIIDLQINYNGFLKQYFSVLDKLNQDLNFPPGERIEHKVVKLMYRYARKRNTPFDYVELVFSNYSQAPLLFKIDFKEDETNIVQTLKSKYGEPRLIDWKANGGQSQYWEKNNDFLIVSLVPDQFGNPEYQIRFFFVKNIKALLENEKTEKEKEKAQRAKSGKKAF
jgi:hypothetical protein